jgi:RHS repeat-associated protein
VISYEEFHPYGSSAYRMARSQAEAPKRYRFTGKERDEESGLMYFGARYYAPWLCRWISCDPADIDLRNPFSVNAYLYANSNPIVYTDTDGRAINLVFAGVGALVGGIAGAAIGAYRAKPGERWAAAGKGAAIGVVTGGLAGLTMGVSLAATGAVGLGGAAVTATTTTGSVLISGTLAGAVGGGSGAAITALSEGASGREAYEAGTIGAFTGSLGGAVAAPLGAGTSQVLKSAGASLLVRSTASGVVGGATGDVVGQTTLIVGGVQDKFQTDQLLVSMGGGGLGGAMYGKATAAKIPLQSTRDQLNAIAARLVRKGWTVTGGGDRVTEEYFSGPGGKTKGSSHVDLTATKDGKTLRIQTVDTRADGRTPTPRETTNAARIRIQMKALNLKGHVILIPKKN